MTPLETRTDLLGDQLVEVTGERAARAFVERLDERTTDRDAPK